MREPLRAIKHDIHLTLHAWLRMQHNCLTGAILTLQLPSLDMLVVKFGIQNFWACCYTTWFSNAQEGHSHSVDLVVARGGWKLVISDTAR